MKLCYITSQNGREITVIYTKSTLIMNFRKESIQERKLDEKFVQLLKIASGFFSHANSLIKTIPYIHKRLLAILLLQNYLLMTFFIFRLTEMPKSLAFAIQKHFTWIQIWKPFKNSIHFFLLSNEEHKITRILSAFNIFLNPRHVWINLRDGYLLMDSPNK